ncbi:MAG: hypothetical protein AAFZ15_24070 [Bacteroidota bacterium]
MKKFTYFLSLLFLTTFLFIACNKDSDTTDDPDELLFQSLCSASTGTLDLRVGNKKWGNSCALTYSVDYSQLGLGDSLYLVITSYTGEGIYLNDGSFEWFTLAILIDQGTGTYSFDEVNGGACYYSGIIEYTNGPGGPQGNTTNEQSFCTDTESNNNQVIIESIDGNKVKGTFDLVAFDEDGQSLELEGEFDVEYLE